MSEMSVSGGNSSSTIAASPTRPTARNDDRSPRRQACNVDFGVSNTSPPPPCTSNVRNVNVEGMQRRFAGIASSIHDLTRHAMMRAVYVVNYDLIKAIEEIH